MADDLRPIWILVDGHHPVALAAIGRKRFPRGVRYWCHEGDPCWYLITADDRDRLERRMRSGRRRDHLSEMPEMPEMEPAS